jgi:hypothetical protein
VKAAATLDKPKAASSTRSWRDGATTAQTAIDMDEGEKKWKRRLRGNRADQAPTLL